jgi:hypothetical protein
VPIRRLRPVQVVKHLMRMLETSAKGKQQLKKGHVFDKQRNKGRLGRLWQA